MERKHVRRKDQNSDCQFHHIIILTWMQNKAEGGSNLHWKQRGCPIFIKTVQKNEKIVDLILLLMSNLHYLYHYEAGTRPTNSNNRRSDHGIHNTNKRNGFQREDYSGNPDRSKDPVQHYAVVPDQIEAIRLELTKPLKPATALSSMGAPGDIRPLDH